MRPESDKKKEAEVRKNIIPSRTVNVPENLEGAEETEIAAQISVPQEGGWGWIVVFSSFFCIFVLDGVSFTFGSIIKDMSADLEASESLTALVNSIALALYFTAAPFASAFINRFGFRSCAMTGSITCALALFCSYFVTTISMLCIFYGVVAGIGYCFLNMASCLVVGFYFEKLRSLALAISTMGSSVGIMLMFPINAYLVNLAGWRITTLLHSGLFGLTFYFSMVYKPLLSLTVIRTTDDATRTVTYLPSLTSAAVRAAPSRVRSQMITSTATERLFSAVSNVHFPTAAEVVDEGVVPSSQPGPSTAPVSKLTITAHHPQGGLSQRQLKQVKSIISKTSVQDKVKTIELATHAEPPKKRSCWARLCHWEEHVQESRPMYRDDAFYDGRIDKLPVYQKSMMDTSAEPRTGLEYQMAVSRAVTTADLKEKRGIFTTAVRRILATMMDPKLLIRCSFRMLCISGFLMFVGFLVPYVFIQDRNISVGIDPIHCNLYVSVIGFSNLLGKLIIGALACKLDPLKLYYISCIAAGIATIISNLSFNVYFQYAYCLVFGFFVGSLACLRSVILVDLYGLEKLTNATGIMLVFQGFGSLVSTPTSSMIQSKYGYTTAFSIAGASLLISGIILLPVNALCKKENDKENSAATKLPVNIQKIK